MGYSPWGHIELDMTEHEHIYIHTHIQILIIYSHYKNATPLMIESHPSVLGWFQEPPLTPKSAGAQVPHKQGCSTMNTEKTGLTACMWRDSPLPSSLEVALLRVSCAFWLVYMCAHAEIHILLRF